MTAEWLTMLIDAGVKSTVILLVAGMLALALRRASAATRHFVWTLALGSLLALPALSHVLPAWHVPVASDSVIQFLVREMAGQPVAPPAVTDPGSAPGETNLNIEVEEGTVLRDAASAPTNPDPDPNPADSSSAPPSFLTSWGGPTWLLIWAIGAALVLLRLVAGSIGVWWIARRTTPIEDRGWRDLRDVVVTQIGLTSTPDLRQGRTAATPMTWGVLRPVVLLPPDAHSWSEERRRIVLLHEVAHVKRRDCLTQTLAQLACALYWFNPLVWIAAARLQAEREHACDDLVLSSGTPAPDYARHLLEIARSLRASGAPAWATVSMARRSQLEGRLLAILDPALSRRTITRVLRAAGVVAVICLVLPVAALRIGDASVQADGHQTQDLPIDTLEQGFPPHSLGAPEPRPAPGVGIRDWGLGVGLDEEQLERAIEGALGAGGAAIAGVDRHAIDETIREALAHVDLSGVIAGGLEVDYDEAVARALDKLRYRQSRSAGDRKTNEQAVQALATALKDQDVTVRRQAALALGELRNRVAVPGLVQALTDSDPGVRQAAASALGELRDERSVEPLTSALNDSDRGVRRRAISALGELRDVRAVPGLIEATRVEDPEIRQRAVSALGEIRDVRAVDALVVALQDRDVEVRQRAVSALGELRDARSVEPLIAAMNDSDPGVRHRAMAALSEVRDPRAVPALVAALKAETPRTRQRAASALGELNDARAVEPLMAALKDPDAGVRMRAASALGELR